jgi:hypothetical protein
MEKNTDKFKYKEGKTFPSYLMCLESCAVNILALFPPGLFYIFLHK